MTRDEFEAGGRALCELAGEDPDKVIDGQPAWLCAALGIIRVRWELEEEPTSSDDEAQTQMLH